jgi:tRNA 5-methylaminomethyl-2-thiouridine biosynthesis bifunctional protein
VIGAGLAGSATAASLAARGWQVSVLERHDGPAQEASGNPQGVLYLKLSAHGTALSQMIVSGFGYTRRQLERLQRGHRLGRLRRAATGLRRQGSRTPGQTGRGVRQQPAAPAGPRPGPAVAGVGLPAGGLYYPEGAGCIRPRCARRSRASAHSPAEPRHVLELRKVDGQWQAWDGERLLASAPWWCWPAPPRCALRPAPAAAQAHSRADHPLAGHRRQPGAARWCAPKAMWRRRVGEHTLGASFDFHSDTTPTTAEHQGNLALLDEISTDLAQRLAVAELDVEQLQGRAAFRCTSPDYLPIVGPVADTEAFNEAYAALAKDARQVPDIACPWLAGLYVNSGHGSRGLITAPLSGN